MKQELAFVYSKRVNNVNKKLRQGKGLDLMFSLGEQPSITEGDPARFYLSNA